MTKIKTHNCFLVITEDCCEYKKNMVVLTVEELNNIVDNFLRCYPEYRCLDIIGKFANHKHSKYE